MYDFYLGGSNHTDADRIAGEQMLETMPTVKEIARANRAFLARVVRHLTTAGIRQFLDVGSGIPTAGNVHEIAQAASPDSRVLYVDIDAEAVAHSNELLRGNDHAAAIQADLATPAAILDHPERERLLDLSRPTALLFMSVLQFIPDEAVNPGVGTLRDALAPGSYLALSHPVVDPGDERAAAIGAIYRPTNARTAVPRSRKQLASLFGDYRPIDPGLTWVTHWRPDTDPGPADPVGMPMVVGVARKPTAIAV
jgi:SAM-dependent methyltransferase